MTENLVEKINKLLIENPDRKQGAARAAESDLYNCYSWDDHSDIIKEYCWATVDFYNIVAEGNAEKIAQFINSECDSLKKSYLSRIKNAEDWLD